MLFVCLLFRVLCSSNERPLYGEGLIMLLLIIKQGLAESEKEREDRKSVV